VGLPWPWTWTCILLSLRAHAARIKRGRVPKSLNAENAEESAEFAEKINPNYLFQFFVRLSR